MKGTGGCSQRFEKMREQWKRPGDFVRASTQIINHRSNAHFGRWTRQMWFKINIKNPFPLRNRVPSHILSAAEVMGRRVYMHVRVKSKFVGVRENPCKMIPNFTRYHHSLVRCYNWILKRQMIITFLHRYELYFRSSAKSIKCVGANY